MRIRLPVFLAFLVLSFLQGGCQAMRKASDHGHRILDTGSRPASRFLGYTGSVVGYTAGLPFTLLLLPTYPFEDFQYPSGPEHDVEMPKLFAPLEIGGGVGAYLLARPVEMIEDKVGRKKRQDHEAPPSPPFPTGS